jgi:uncharacterized protein (TIGR02266 family)
MGDPGAERPPRKHPRYEVEIRVDWSTGQMFVSDRITNISEGGVFIRSGMPPPEGARVEMVFWPAGGSPIRAVGHVVWSQGSQEAYALPSGVMPGGGLRFTEMHPADRAMLRQYLIEIATGAKRPPGH